MEFEYVIVQCGGKGTRLGKYTSNRPKALVPVQNRPILFHLFERYCGKKFIVISDYKSDVLNRYLEVFAKVNYLSVITDAPGNIAGIRTALTYIPEGSAFLLLWSDLILGNGFAPEHLQEGNYVGITGRFPCSWSFKNGKLAKECDPESGVAGCFFFRDKSGLADIPESGSFTRWLMDAGLPLLPMDMADSFETGTVEALHEHSSIENRCRPYNRIDMYEDRVVKTGLTAEAEKLLDREAAWYHVLADAGFSGIPKIYSEKPLTMERIAGTNIFRAGIDEDRKLYVLQKLVGTLDKMHRLEKGRVDYFDIQWDYYHKTVDRMRSIGDVVPFAADKEICINGKMCVNPLRQREVFQKADMQFMNRRPRFGIIHGDCTFTNTLIDENENIFFIDARGYFGNTGIIGDICYDWAKVYYSVVGSFDQFNIRNFELEIRENEVSFKIAPSGWERYEADFFRFISSAGENDARLVHYIHSIIWLSLASHCWEDYDSMCLAFYNGVFLFQQVLDELMQGENI